jgi:hypothetical protein
MPSEHGASPDGLGQIAKTALKLVGPQAALIFKRKDYGIKMPPRVLIIYE